MVQQKPENSLFGQNSIIIVNFLAWRMPHAFFVRLIQ
jgi:hypothetical protein